MANRERLQLRMSSGLKQWFEKYAESRGGMSRLVRGHVEELYSQVTGTPWRKEEDNELDPADKDGSGDGGTSADKEHALRPPRHRT